MNSILTTTAVAGLLLASVTTIHAEEIEKKFRLGFSVGAFDTADDLHSTSANRRTLFLPNGEFDDQIYDPRNDSAASSNFGVRSELGAVLSASYAFNRLWYVEASAGYRTGEVGNVEVQAQFNGTKIPINQSFAFSIFNLSGGTVKQIPLQLTAGIRFRPKASLNPYVCAGVGYTFNSFEPSDELNQLSRDLDSSIGGFARVQGTLFGGEQFATGGTLANLSGISMDVPDAPEWHFGGGMEYSFKSRWVVFLDARYMVYSGSLAMTINGSNELGVSVPSDRRYTTDPDAYGPFGAFQITSGGLIDGGSWVPEGTAPEGTDCSVSHQNCEFTGPQDGVKDPGYYYVHAGSVRWDGFSLQLGVKFTF